MSTHSLIAYQISPTTIKTIYVNFDGYLDCVGQTLLTHYTDPTKVQALMDLGDLSCLGSEIGEKQNFDKPTNENWCLSYGRDRGEENVSSQEFNDFVRFNDYSRNYEYAYLFTEENCWQYRVDGKDWKVLDQKAIDESREDNE